MQIDQFYFNFLLQFKFFNMRCKTRFRLLYASIQCAELNRFLAVHGHHNIEVYVVSSRCILKTFISDYS